ncbi:MAG: 30S ribosomal protein S24e [Thermoprotei archaeon]|nr:MAG: 30S ribosomal protein S24e [Thermoprotei archaeon]
MKGPFRGIGGVSAISQEQVKQVDRVEIVEDKYNKPLSRRELKLRVIHVLKGTPSRQTLRKIVSNMFKVPLDRVFIRKIETEYGLCESSVEVHIYDSLEQAKQIEPEYIILRNMPELKSQSKSSE